jgi:hypothetical protein
MCPVAGHEGKIGNSAYFDGDDLLAVPHDTDLDPGDGFSIGAWIVPETLTVSAPIIVKSTDDRLSDGYGIYYDAETRSVCGFVGGAQSSIVCTPFLREGVFGHVALVNDGIDTMLYVNGKRAGVARGGAASGNEMPLFIGGNGISTGWRGGIDELFFFKRALTPEEVVGVYIRGAVDVSYQLRSCANERCGGVRFVGPDGTSDTYFSGTADWSFNSDKRLFTISDDRYFQYRVYLHADTDMHAPKIMDIHVGYGYGGINGERTADKCINLAPFFEEKYIKDHMPIDPESGTSIKTQYAIKRTEGGRIIVKACHSGGDEIISVIK